MKPIRLLFLLTMIGLLWSCTDKDGPDGPVKTIPAPTEVNAKIDENKVYVTWSEVAAADSYEVWRSNEGTEYALLGTSEETEFVDVYPVKGVNNYKIKSRNGSTAVSELSSATASVVFGYTLTDNGMYMGIMGFNDNLYNKDMSLLNKTTAESFKSFVSNLPMAQGTILYYAVETAVDNMASYTYPTTLDNVSLITFTDGLDEGSQGMNDKYSTDDQYLEHVHQKIKTTMIGGKPINAYSIGIYQEGVVSNKEKFTNNLNKLASSATNAYTVADMNELNKTFSDMASNLIKKNRIQVIKLRIPSPANGQRVRFTFDNVSSAAESNCYLEGVFNATEKSLTDVTYFGFLCDSGTSVKATTVDGIWCTFEFKNTRSSSGSFLPVGNVNEYKYESGVWNLYTVFSLGGGATQTIDSKTAVIMLVLDCSSSLGGKFADLKQYVNNFITAIANGYNSEGDEGPTTMESFAQNAVILRTSDKAEMTNYVLYRGNILDLYIGNNATKAPYSYKYVRWNSSNPSVATVDPAIGNSTSVTVVGIGTTVITATDDMGGKRSVTVTVTRQTFDQNAVILRTSDKTEQASYELYKGNTLGLYIGNRSTKEAYPYDKVNWKSTSTTVATVNPSVGNSTTVTASGIGTTTIVATDEAGETRSVVVKVIEKPTFVDQTITAGGVTFKMIAVEGGTFTMGATAEQGSDYDSMERPAHSVRLSDFYIGKYEVTQKLWETVMGSNPSSYKGANLPVERVSWIDCQTFITKLNLMTGKNFRLPTEAEWEYAARGGKKSQGYKYAGGNVIGNVAWYSGNSGINKHEVGTKQPNELGIYDMSGNVREWCQDWYDSYSSSADNNPTGPRSGFYRVCRGGSRDCNAWWCRLSSRGYSGPAYAYDDLGFRLKLLK